jgi:hypothetical protein
VQGGTVVNVQYVQVNVLIVEQSLQDLHLVVLGLVRSGIFHTGQFRRVQFLALNLDETVENGRAVEFVKTVDGDSVLNEKFAYFRRGVEVLGVRDQVVQGVAFVEVLELGIGAFVIHDAFDVLKSELVLFLDNLNERYLVHDIDIVDRAAKSPQQVNKRNLPVNSTVQQRCGPVNIQHI